MSEISNTPTGDSSPKNQDSLTNSNYSGKHIPIFDENLPPVESIYSPEITMRESQNLFKKYLRSPRYQQTSIDFLDYSLTLPDAQSFIWQFKDIYELENYKFQPKTRNPIIIDCRANVGTSCLYFAKTYPNSQIFAFEPDKIVFKYLENNIKNNNITNVTLYNSAVWIEDGELEFSSKGADGGTLLLSSNNMIKVKAISLNDFLSQFDYVDFLKLDIEGVEDVVLESCKDNLYKIENFFIEYHSFYGKKQNYDEVLKTLTDYDFRYYTNTANNIPKPFFNKTKYGTMDLQINIYASREKSAASYISKSNINSSTVINGITSTTNAKIELQARRNIFSKSTESISELKLLNLGCGANFHPAWTNIDFTSTGIGVKAHNLLHGIPSNDESFDFIYHSHVLEHFPKSKAQNFINECFRVLKPGGLIRIAIPDLEQIAKLYLEKLDKAAHGDSSSVDDYDWMMLELLDQTVRNQSGGDMQKYLGIDNLNNMDFVRERIGIYADSIRNSCLSAKQHPHYNDKAKIANTPEEYLNIGAFRMGGEIHQWMYDRFSLARLLDKSGFKHIGIVSAYESSFDKFSSYNLDVKNGSIVKADSLFIEAIKPSNSDIQESKNDLATEKPSIPSIFQNNGEIKVLTLSSKDSGGAGGAARRIHEAILKAGADAVMIVLDKATNSDRVAELEVPIPNLDRNQPSAQLFHAFNIIQSKLSNYPDKSNLEMFTSTESIVDYNELAPYIQQADIINVHWIDGFFDYYNAPEAFKGKHIAWTLHDMYQFTGGCHYALDCTNYIIGCNSCPQLVKDNSQTQLSQTSFNTKAQAYNNLDIHVITPSTWLGNCAKKSKLMCNMPLSVIHNPFDPDKIKPINQLKARNRFNIPTDKKIILFGADTVLRPVKNLKALITALSELCDDKTINKDEFQLIVFGQGKFNTDNIPFDIVQMGLIKSSEDITYLYSSADFLVLPSITDNFPNIMCESLACGTPVVGFNIGGLPDLIENNKTGYLAEAFDSSQFKKGIIWGLTTAYNNQEIRNNCRMKFENEVSEDIIAKKTLDLFNKIVNTSTSDRNISNLNSITSNDQLRGHYIHTLLNCDTSQIAQTANSFTTEITNWLVNTLLPHRNLTEQEAKLKIECLSKLSSGNTTDLEYLKSLLLAVVLVPAEELPLVINIYKQPDSIKDLLTQYIFSFKEIPSHSGFTESTLKHMTNYLEMFKNECDKNPHNASKLIMSAFNTLRKIPIYCATGGLCKVMKLTANMMRELLVLNNAAVEYTFPERNITGKIKLGILLQALSEHTETYATLPAFTNLNRDEYEIFVYVLKITNSSQELQYKDCYDHIIEISATQIPQSVNKIREANLDIILIGTNITALANHNALISTHRLARVQAVHFCNPCTTGIKNIDYFITGNNYDLKQEDFTEKLIYNKHSGVCFEAATTVKPATLEITKASLGVPDDGIIFITGANYYKFTWELREFWAKLLNEIPNSYLLTLPFGPAWTNKYPVSEFNQSIQKQFAEIGVEQNRLIIIKPLPTREDVRRAVGLCDIYLDSFPYSGATSLLDPLHTNVPVVCMKTNSIRGGQGCGMLEDVGLTELIANTEEEYLELAKRLANDIEYRKKISNTIQETMNNNPVFLDTKDYCSDMDRIYKSMITEYDNNYKKISTNNTNMSQDTKQPRLKPNDICNCGSGLKYKKCCGK